MSLMPHKQKAHRSRVALETSFSSQGARGGLRTYFEINEQATRFNLVACGYRGGWDGFPLRQGPLAATRVGIPIPPRVPCNC